jgi:monofunctional chorismate mutase, gram positive-type, clade 2
MKDLKTCRDEIDIIDQQIIDLFEKRMNVAKDVVNYKLEHQMEIFQAEREKQVIEKNVQRVHTDELKKYAQLFIQDMMNVSKAYQASFVPSKKTYELKEPKSHDIVVGYQGVPGSFSEHALEKYFSQDIKRKNYQHFEDVFQALLRDEIDYGVVPLENSSTGAINDNYDLIRDYGFFIVGEQSLSISQHLLGVKGSCIEELTDVYSHPQGILQCSHFLGQHQHIHPHEYENTATAAQYVSSKKDKRFAAIASSKAAKLYHLDILQENIQDIKSNSTRFIIFGKNLEKRADATCVSVVFTVKHEIGALYEVMKVINDHQINMLRIESRPLKETPWEYYFYVDFEGQLEDVSIIQAIESIKAYTNTLRILGNYPKR